MIKNILVKGNDNSRILVDQTSSYRNNFSSSERKGSISNVLSGESEAYMQTRHEIESYRLNLAKKNQSYSIKDKYGRPILPNRL